ncbi:hypothetical protein HMPREF1548_03984 [Clostridium sp. KLE 1755]|nr:hypothetical protein HMPREF1548_03984 [Clostridium sp. KLE 1755]
MSLSSFSIMFSFLSRTDVLFFYNKTSVRICQFPTLNIIYNIRCPIKLPQQASLLYFLLH